MTTRYNINSMNNNIIKRIENLTETWKLFHQISVREKAQNQKEKLERKQQEGKEHKEALLTIVINDLT